MSCTRYLSISRMRLYSDDVLYVTRVASSVFDVILTIKRDKERKLKCLGLKESLAAVSRSCKCDTKATVERSWSILH